MRNNRQGRSGDDFGSNKNPLSRRAKMLIQNYVDLIRFRCWKMRKGEGESEELARNAAKCFYYSSLSGETRGNVRTKANVYGVFISCTWRRRVASRRRETRRERFDTSQGFIRFRIFLFLFFLFPFAAVKERSSCYLHRILDFYFAAGKRSLSFSFLHKLS